MKKWTILSFSNIGKRDENQDFLSCISIKKNKRVIDVLIVCDGVGGRPSGQECSRTIGNEIQKEVLSFIRNRKTKSCLNRHDLTILKRNLSGLKKLKASPMSRTTLALTLVDRKRNRYGNSCLTLWAGDSRIYAVESNGKAFQISNDQYNENGHISVVFTGEGKLIGEMGSQQLYLKEPLLICSTTDGMNCVLNDLFKFLVQCVYFRIQDDHIFEKKATKFLGNLVSDNYSVALLYRDHSDSVISKTYDKIPN